MRTRLWPLLAALGLLASAAHAGPARGSGEEKAEFERHQLASDRLGKTGAQLSDEVTTALAPGERPSLRFLKKGGKMKALSAPSAPQAPAAAPAFLNKEIRPPSDFAVEYELGQDAAITISIVGPNGVALHELNVPAGEPGGRRGKNRVLAWDGRDALGREAPAGSYQAIVIVRPGPGAPAPDDAAKIIMLFKAPQ